MTTISPLSRAVATAPPSVAAWSSAAASPSGATTGGESSVVSLGAASAKPSSPTLVWENRFRTAASTMMAQNFNSQPAAGRLTGLGAELLKQVAYDGQDFTQSVQQVPQDVATVGTYDMLVAPPQVSQHGMGDNQFKLTITTRSGVKVELALDAGDNSIAIDAHSSAKLNDAERAALGKLADAFQQSIDGLSKGRVDLSGLTQYDSAVLSSVDLKAQLKVGPAQTQQLEFHADAGQRSVSFSGPAGSAKIGVDLSQPASWGSKEQQAKALNRYLQQVDQAGLRGQGNGTMLTMFKDAFTDMNSDYGKPVTAPRSIYLSDQDSALTTGLADFTASMSQAESASNPMRATEKDTFAYELSQKTMIAGHSQLDRAITQQQQSHLKASYHAPLKADARLALDLRPQSQNYKFVSIDDSASSTTSIEYDQGVLKKAALEMQASRTTRVLTYTLGKLKDDQTTPSGKAVARDLLDTLEPERAGGVRLEGAERDRALAALHEQIFLQSNPDALTR